MATGLDALAGRFGPDQPDFTVVEEGVEDPDRIAAAADAGGDEVRQAAIFGQHLRPRLAADDGIEVADHARIRVRAGDGTDDVEGVLDVADPVAHGFVQGVLERGRTTAHRHHRGAQQAHAVDVGLLPLDVGGAHVDHALQAQARGHGGTGHAVLAGAGLGDDPGLAHAAGQQRLADGVVDLVRAGVVEVLALEQDLRPAHLAAQPLRVIDRTGPAHVMGQVAVVFGDEGRIDPGRVIGCGQLLQRPDQGLGDEAPAVAAVMPGGIGIGVEVTDGGVGHGCGDGWDWSDMLAQPVAGP
jgi:hypothetical protein